VIVNMADRIALSPIWNFRMRAVGAIVLAFWAALFFNGPASAEKRVALVIGNSAYQNVNSLTNPTNDSGAISETLKNAGFDVVDLRRDLKVAEMRAGHLETSLTRFAMPM
jgi:Caspase domain